MAPQATLVVPTPTATPAVSTHAAAKPGRKPFVPELLLIFLGICLAYTLSYVLYRVVMARRRASHQDAPDTPDRGVSRFMNGARLTLNFGHKHAATPTPSESPNIPDKEKLPTGTSQSSHPELPMPSPAESSSTPYMALMPTFTVHPNQEISQLHLQSQGPVQVPSFAPPPGPPPAHQPFTQRLAAKVRFLSSDRAEAITLDPKLAPVQGPLRPLSTADISSRQKRTSLFGLGLKPVRTRHEDPRAGLVMR